MVLLSQEDREALRRGAEEFNAGYYFECHDTLEEAWAGIRGEARDFFQGLIQVSVGLYHWRNGNAGGAATMLERGDEAPLPLPGDLRRVRSRRAPPGGRRGAPTGEERREPFPRRRTPFRSTGSPMRSTYLRGTLRGQRTPIRNSGFPLLHLLPAPNGGRSDRGATPLAGARSPVLEEPPAPPTGARGGGRSSGPLGAGDRVAAGPRARDGPRSGAACASAGSRPPRRPAGEATAGGATARGTAGRCGPRAARDRRGGEPLGGCERACRGAIGDAKGGGWPPATMPFDRRTALVLPSADLRPQPMRGSAPGLASARGSRPA